jgi:hypothetical protein
MEDTRSVLECASALAPCQAQAIPGAHECGAAAHAVQNLAENATRYLGLSVGISEDADGASRSDGMTVAVDFSPRIVAKNEPPSRSDG